MFDDKEYKLDYILSSGIVAFVYCTQILCGPHKSSQQISMTYWSSYNYVNSLHITDFFFLKMLSCPVDKEFEGYFVTQWII